MEEYEAYCLLFKLLEQVNAFCSLFRNKEVNSNLEETHPFYFDPRKGNVIFGSAIDGWAFR